jgi:hypothetical protein
MTFSPVVLVRTANPSPSIASSPINQVLHKHRTNATQSQENTPSQFKWRGSIPLLLNGDHFFRFEPSTITPGGTTFTHGEEFSGLMAGPFSWFGMGSKAGPGFAKFNGDLKREAEKEVEAE